MSRKCSNQGRAYEFAWINALAYALAPERNVVVTKNSSYEANRRAWDSLAPDKQELYRISASAAIPTILEHDGEQRRHAHTDTAEGRKRHYRPRITIRLSVTMPNG